MRRLLQTAAIGMALVSGVAGCDRDDGRAAARTRYEVPAAREAPAARTVPTAEDQSSEAADVEITRVIREGVTADATLSLGARACTVVTRANVVTLRGGVANESERNTIGAIARRTAGVSRVDNLLEFAN